MSYQIASTNDPHMYMYYSPLSLLAVKSHASRHKVLQLSMAEESSSSEEEGT